MHLSQFQMQINTNCFNSLVKCYSIWFCCYCIIKSAYLHQVVKEPCIERFGQGISCVGGLLLVQGHVNGLRLPAPLWIHLPAGQLLLQTVGVDAQQIGREGKHWSTDRRLYVSVEQPIYNCARKVIRRLRYVCLPDNVSLHHKYEHNNANNSIHVLILGNDCGLVQLPP